MRSQVIFLLFFFGCSFPLFSQTRLTPAQKRFADSLSKALTGQGDSSKHQMLLTLFNKNKSKNYNRAIIVAKRALPLVRKLSTLEELATFYRDIGSLECRWGEENTAAPYYREAARIYKSLNQPATQATVYEELVKCSEAKGDFKTAYYNELRARTIRDSISQGIETQRYNELLNKYTIENRADDSVISKQKEQLQNVTSHSEASEAYNKNLIKIIGSALGIFFLLWVIYLIGRRRFKVRLLRERALRQTDKKERLHISKDVHEVIGHDLVKIHTLAGSVIERSTQSEVREYGVEIGDLSIHLLETTKDLVWQLNLENATLPVLVEKIKEFSTEILEPTAIGLVGKYPETVPDIPIQKVSFRNIFMVVKETFSNIIRHSKAMNVSVTVAIVNERLHIDIKDDGLGFDRTLERGAGIEMMETRMRTIGGLVNINSELNHGTAVAIDIGIIQIQRKEKT